MARRWLLGVNGRHLAVNEICVLLAGQNNK